MPIKWNALMVSEAMDMVEEYVDQDIARLISEIERAVGGSQWEPIGRLRSAIESVRKSIPDGAVEAEWESARQGNQLALV